MFDTLMANAGDYIHTNPQLAIAAIFIGGVLTASSPCVLAMIPLMMSFVGICTRLSERIEAHLVFI